MEDVWRDGLFLCLDIFWVFIKVVMRLIFHGHDISRVPQHTSLNGGTAFYELG